MSIAQLPRAAAVPTVTAAQMSEIDRIASTELGIPLDVLMENAARQVAAATRALLGETEGQLVAAVVGGGHNGGDALAALRHLLSWGAEVDAYLAVPPDELRPLARMQRDILARLGVDLYETSAIEQGNLAHRLRARHAVIDGLLGSGSKGAPRGEIARLIRATNEAQAGAVIAVDLPSGLDPDSGAPLASRDDVIRASLTVTLGLPKAGLVSERAREFVGELVLADIGIPSAAFKRLGVDTREVFLRSDLVLLTP